MSTTTITVRVDPEVALRLQRLAKATRRTKSFLAAEAIGEYVALQEWQVAAIQAGAAQADREEGVELDEVKRRWENRLADSAH